MSQKRIQLTLFLNEQESESIEKIRREFNPIQYELIKAHVTLCREDELEQLEKVMKNLTGLDHGHVAIDFGAVARFSDGKGVFIPAIGEKKPFQNLRARILQGVIDKPRIQEPHITLMHPRNATCTDEIFEQIKQCNFPNKMVFQKISLIEQTNGMRWNILEQFDLKHTI